MAIHRARCATPPDTTREFSSDQTLALTLAPTELNEWLPPLCTVCKRLFKKLVSEALDDWLEAEPDEELAVLLPAL